jgi:hypothetical protein
VQGAGETLRGTLNSSVDRRFGANHQTTAKDQAAIETGRYEVENGRFEHWGQSQSSQQPVAQPIIAGDETSASSDSYGPGSRDGEHASAGLLGGLIHKAAKRATSGRVPDEFVIDQPPKPRSRLKKKSSSKLSAVNE